jgi:hypothetical protein
MLQLLTFTQRYKLSYFLPQNINKKITYVSLLIYQTAKLFSQAIALPVSLKTFTGTGGL